MKKLFLFITFFCVTSFTFSQTGPSPGDIYREYAVNLKVGNNWRVTDPAVTRPDAVVFLPNPVMNITIDDLAGAVRAEVLMDIWGGHVGTSNKRFRFNQNDWIRIPELPNTPLQPECYMSQYNVIMDLPLNYLQAGVNTFEGTSGGQICNSYNWGQWGWYVMMVRIYYGPDKAHTKGGIAYPLSGSVITDNPEISVSVQQPENVSEVQILGKYLGYDQKGQGYFYDWHWAYHGVNIVGHIGTATSSPYKQTWNTSWVPDQEPENVAFMARIKDKNGVWYVTELADNITLDRTNAPSVRLFTATEIPTPFVVRILGNGNPNTRGCKIAIPNLNTAIEARLFHRTWNAADDDAARGTVELPLGVNGNGFKTFGVNHNFSLSAVPIPVNNLLVGQNNVTYSSNTVHHGIEVLWPGPAILVRYETPFTIDPEPDSDILAYWSFNENQGDKAMDGSEFSNHLTLIQGAGWDEGKYGSALMLDKANKSYAFIPDASLSTRFPAALFGEAAESFTIAAWIKLNSANDDRSPIITKEYRDNRGLEFGIKNGRLAAQIFKDNTNGTRIESNGAVLENGKWYHAAMTYEFITDGTSVIKFYLDGELDFFVDNSMGPLKKNGADLRVGAYIYDGNFQRFFNGWIDELYVKDRILSREEIVKLTNSATLPSNVPLKNIGSNRLSVFPNPFGENAVFEFSLKADDFVELKVFNIQGQEIAGIINQRLNAGTHRKHFSSEGIPSGVYFARLKTGEFSVTKRLVIAD